MSQEKSWKYNSTCLSYILVYYILKLDFNILYYEL